VAINPFAIPLIIPPSALESLLLVSLAPQNNECAILTQTNARYVARKPWKHDLAWSIIVRCSIMSLCALPPN
jgi:hypothetical protein